jgi:hypothetical protein
MTGMQEHLTDRELDALLMGAEETVFESVRKLHLRDCGTCRARLAEMRAMTESFRDGVMLWQMPAEVSRRESGILPLRHAQSQNARAKFNGWRMMPAMGLVALMVVGAMTPHWLHERQVQSTVVESAQGVGIAPTSQKRDVGHPVSAAPSDDVLMQQVQQQLEESVPESMAPLTALIQTENPHKTARQEKEN